MQIGGALLCKSNLRAAVQHVVTAALVLFGQAFEFAANVADHGKGRQRFFCIVHHPDANGKKVELFQFSLAVGGHHIPVFAVLFVVKRGRHRVYFLGDFPGDIFRLVKRRNHNKIIPADMSHKRSRVLVGGGYNNLRSRFYLSSKRKDELLLV